MTQAYAIEVLHEDGTPYGRRIFDGMSGLELSRADAETRLTELASRPTWDRYSRDGGCLTAVRLRIVEVTIGGDEERDAEGPTG